MYIVYRPLVSVRYC